MSKTRENGWTLEDDTTLVNTVIEHLARGSKLSTAFKEVAEKLERTPGACNFRYTNTLKEKHKSAIMKAKKSAEKIKNQLKNRRSKTQVAETSTKAEIVSNAKVSKKVTPNQVSLATEQVEKPVSPLELVSASFTHWKKLNEELKLLRSKAESSEGDETLIKQIEDLQTENLELQEQVREYQKALSMLEKLYQFSQVGEFPDSLEEERNDNRAIG